MLLELSTKTVNTVTCNTVVSCWLVRTIAMLSSLACQMPFLTSCSESKTHSLMSWLHCISVTTVCLVSSKRTGWRSAHELKRLCTNFVWGVNPRTWLSSSLIRYHVPSRTLWSSKALHTEIYFYLTDRKSFRYVEDMARNNISDSSRTIGTLLSFTKHQKNFLKISWFLQ